MALFVKLLSENAKIPIRASKMAAGYDLSSAIKCNLPARGSVIVDTGVCIALPPQTYGRVAPRSGLAIRHCVDVGAGVIDCDYRGELKVLLFNHSDKNFEIQVGDRIAQLIIEKIDTPDVIVVDDLEETERGLGGFGSTVLMSFCCDYLIVGSGVCATSCAQELLRLICKREKVFMISPCSNIKIASSLTKIGRVIEEFQVSEVSSHAFTSSYENFTFFLDFVVSINDVAMSVNTRSQTTFFYKKLILCTGSSPKNRFHGQPLVYTIRDLDSVDCFREKLASSKNVCIVGNGGIALELTHKITNCSVYWIIKQNYVGSTFFDEETSNFFKNIHRNYINIHKTIASPTIEYLSTKKADNSSQPSIIGSAVGPEWSHGLLLTGNNATPSCYPNNLKIFLNSEISSISSNDDSSGLSVTISNGEYFDCDFLIFATGTTPNSEITKTTKTEILLNDEDAIIVDDNMRTCIPTIFAAGDCCTVRLKDTSSLNPHPWFQMKLWTQAKYMGVYVAQCAIEHQNMLPIHFDIFAHCTHFFGLNVCLLGLYNGQGLNARDTISYVRSNVDHFIRVIIFNSRIVGAVLIGNTDMEETMENLILSAIDISSIGENILNPDIDIADYFD